MKALISLAILISFLFSNSSCDECGGQVVQKKEECKELTPDSGKKCCFQTREDVTNKELKIHQCYSFSQEEIDNKENTMNKYSDEQSKTIDIDCDLSSSGGNTGNKENDANTGNKEEDRTRDNSSSKSIYLYESVLILLLLLIL